MKIPAYEFKKTLSSTFNPRGTRYIPNIARITRVHCDKPRLDRPSNCAKSKQSVNDSAKFEKLITLVIQRTKTIVKHGLKIIKHKLICLKLGLKGSSPVAYVVSWVTIYVVIVLSALTLATLVLFNTNVWLHSNPLLALYGSHNGMIGLLLGPLTVIYVVEKESNKLTDFQVLLRMLEFCSQSFPSGISLLVLSSVYGGTAVSGVVFLKGFYKRLPKKHKRKFVLLVVMVIILSVSYFFAHLPAYAAETSNSPLTSPKAPVWGLRTLLKWYWGSFDNRPSKLTTKEAMDLIVDKTSEHEDKALQRCLAFDKQTTEAIQSGNFKEAAEATARTSECWEHYQNFRHLLETTNNTAKRVEHGLSTPSEFAGQAVQDVTRETLRPYAEAAVAGAATAAAQEAAAAANALNRGSAETDYDLPNSPRVLDGTDIWN